MFFPLKNSKIFYQTSGCGDEVILFIHGLGSSLDDWQRQVEFFKKDYFCLVPDLRGFGKSSSDLGFDIPSFAADVINLVTHLKIDKIHLVGISLGGMVAFQIAVTNPQLLKSLTIVNALPEFKLRGFGTKLQFYSRVFLVGIFGMKIFARILAKKLFPKANQQNLRQELIKNFSQNNKKTYLKTLLAMQGWSVVNQLENINCKTLFIAAENDYTGLQEKKFFSQKINAKIAVIKDSHHAVCAEKPQEFNKILQQFLENV